ncbi:glycosyltransferase family 4 protein [Niveispirillum cyanobacteriorum]|uniref:Uncharacterized protein n=1 Tax=Niveispirillum cyanobacteriorum TaxID=1612173 RepID=A0A2K9NLL4_9PROT|nr:glycosyltransferase family 4 protein [Niveispirillum cyanobacteriorum]AUN33964.1 hypothetical protein C0V82_26585 [Niveispirillum cyanobacteriorum]GGE89156.1 hypothetical protein GCM10011317_52710 [Niveispirillum cyanobacteriorum]
MTYDQKFILIDPSFDSAAGDKWQYAVTFAKSAIQNGYKFSLLAGKNSPLIADAVGSEIDQRNVFDFAFYEHGKIVGRHAATRGRMANRARVRHDALQLQELDRMIDRMRSEGDRGGEEYLQRTKRSMLSAFAKKARDALRNLDVAEPLPQPFNRDEFAMALARELASLELKFGDRLFFHTMTPGMLESLQEVTAQMGLKVPLDVDSYFLFHFGKDAPDATTFLDRYHSYSHVPTVSNRIQTGSPFRRLYFLATCDELAEECAQLFRVPTYLFDGLTDLESYFLANGGENETAAVKEMLANTLKHTGQFHVSIRASDVQPGLVKALSQSVALLDKFNLTLKVSILYNERSLHLIRDLAIETKGLNIEFLNVESNNEYIRAITNTHLMLLTYEAPKYLKRVSAVLHDCSVLGTSCIVPTGTTLATARDYADIYVYTEIADITLLILRAARNLRFGSESVRTRRQALARQRYASDVISRLVAAPLMPSLEVQAIAPIATVIAPAWGRCGSSFAIEGHIRTLINAGYFVVQVLVMDKAVDQYEATPFFWSLLEQNSRNIRGHVQRIAFAKYSDHVQLTLTPEYLGGNAFTQFLDRIGVADIWDEQLAKFMLAAQITVVNHVFNTKFARRFGAGRMVLETHDIQSYQMVNWPLINDATGQPETLSTMLASEFDQVRRFDYVVNVAPDEHAVLSLVNPRSRLITPYLPQELIAQPNCYSAISEIAKAWNLDHHYQGLTTFDLLLVGDRHPANCEAGLWFMRDVFIPHLVPMGFSLAIVGKLSDALHERFGAIPGVFYMSVVKDLKTIRSLSHVSVLPDQRGTGISIKTLESFASGMAFAATSVAVRGLADRLPFNLIINDDAEGFAQRLKELVCNKEARQQCADMARRCYDTVSGEGKFFMFWMEILNDLGVRAQSVITVTPTERPPTNFNEYALSPSY